MKKSDKKRKGIFIPDEFFKLDLNSTEREILAIYRYYTVEGDLKCCTYTNQKIADFIKVSVKTVERVKKRFKELGYIRTDGGIRTYYQGQNVRGDLDNLSVGTDNLSVGTDNLSVGTDNLSVGTDNLSVADTDNLSPHNKEEKRIKKENNKEIIKNKKRVNKEEMESELKEKQTVSDRVIDLMKQDKDLKEHIDYIIENYKTEIDDINKKVEELVEEYGITEDEITDTYLKEQIKMLIKNKLFQDNNIKFNTKELHKEKKEVNENDYFDL